MDFGMGSYGDLKLDSFILPPAEYFFPAAPVKQKLFIGLPKWGDLEILMPNVREAQCREEYFKIFNSIELNATHYKIYDEADLTNWLKPLQNPNFLFCPKIYKGISPHGFLRGKEQTIKNFLTSVRSFGPHLGPIFISIRDNFSINRKDELFHFLETISSTEFIFFLEFRDKDWANDQRLKKELAQKLHEFGIGLVITDTPLFRDLVHMNFPIQKAFIRFVCDGNEPLDFFRIDKWAGQLKLLEKNGIESVYFFLHIHQQKYIPDFYNYTVNKFTGGQIEGAGLKLFPEQPPKPPGYSYYPKKKSNE